MLEANDMVEAKMAEIRERKMYEMKRMYAARMDEIFGALTKADIAARRKAGYKKASEILGDPREKERKSPRINPGAKILKKKVSEAVDVEPDPEGRVRGGEPKSGKPVKGTFKRKAVAVAMKGVRKTASLAGKAVNKTLDIAHGIGAANKLSRLRKMRKERDAARAAAAEKVSNKSDDSKKSKKGLKAKRSEYSDTPGGRNRRKADERLARREGPESGKSAWERSIGGKIQSGIKRVADSPFVKDLSDIGTRNL